MPRFKYIKARLSEKLEIPEDAFSASSRLQIIGNCILVSNCKKILRYRSENIEILTSDSIISICGEHLKCIYFYEGSIEIRGEYSDISFRKR